MQRLPLLVAAISVSSCATLAHRGGQEAGTAEKKRRSGPKVELDASIASIVSSNPFRYSDSDLDDFDDEDGEGQRFDGLESEWDVITTVEGGADLEWKVAKGRELQLSLGAEHNAFLMNSIGDYSAFEVRLAYDFTRDDRAKLRIGHVPDRFKKNYKLPSGEFDAAEYQQDTIGIEYEHEFEGDWSVGIGFEAYERDFNTEFDSRDRDADTVFVNTELELTDKLEVGLEIAMATVDTDTERRSGILIDRSFESLAFEPTVKTEVGDWELEISVRLSEREYTTDERADDGRFDRVDDKTRLRLRATRDLAIDGGETFWILGWRENDADLSDPTVPADETGHEEITFGLGFRFSF